MQTWSQNIGAVSTAGRFDHWKRPIQKGNIKSIKSNQRTIKLKFSHAHKKYCHHWINSRTGSKAAKGQQITWWYTKLAAKTLWIANYKRIALKKHANTPKRNLSLKRSHTNRAHTVQRGVESQRKRIQTGSGWKCSLTFKK